MLGGASLHMMAGSTMVFGSDAGTSIGAGPTVIAEGSLNVYAPVSYTHLREGWKKGRVDIQDAGRTFLQQRKFHQAHEARQAHAVHALSLIHI